MGRGLWLMLGMALCAEAQQSVPVPPPAEPSTARPVEPKSGARDPGRPVLRRGGPAAERKPIEEPAARPQDNPAYKVIEVDPEGHAESAVAARQLTPEEILLEKAREFAAAYIESLPNFLVEQHVYRYKGEGLGRSGRSRMN